MQKRFSLLSRVARGCSIKSVNTCLQSWPTDATLLVPKLKTHNLQARHVLGPTDEDLDKETTRFLIKTETERARQEREQEAVDMRRLNAALLGDSQKVLDEAILHGVSGRAKPALPKAALGLASWPRACCLLVKIVLGALILI